MTTISPCDPATLRTLFLFEKLTDDQRERLCREGRVEVHEPGVVFTEGQPAEALYVLIEGTVVLQRRVGEDNVEISRTSMRGVYGGAFMAYLGDRVPQKYPNTMLVPEQSRFYVLGAECFAQIMNEWFPMP
ncbi:MAG TPA: cyclic nucleotide-binding domain-containing protein, partial [Trebonia sp.]